MVLARYRSAASLIGSAATVLEVGCGEGIGSRILAKGRTYYCGIDNDTAALDVARSLHSGTDRTKVEFLPEDILKFPGLWNADAAVSLDVIEHIPVEFEDAYMTAIVGSLSAYGVAVIGTPSASFEHLASPQSKVGHINLYTHNRLHGLMSRYFPVLQMLGMQDTSLHLGHPEARHYHLAVGIGPR